MKDPRLPIAYDTWLQLYLDVKRKNPDLVNNDQEKIRCVFRQPPHAPLVYEWHDDECPSPNVEMFECDVYTLKIRCFEEIAALLDFDKNEFTYDIDAIHFGYSPPPDMRPAVDFLMKLYDLMYWRNEFQAST